MKVQMNKVGFAYFQNCGNFSIARTFRIFPKPNKLLFKATQTFIES